MPGTGNTATFNGAGNANTGLVLGAGVTIGSILFDTANAAAYTIGGGGETLTLDPAGTVTMNATVGVTETIGADVVLGTANGNNAFTLTNSSTTASLDFAGGISSGALTGVKTVTFAGAGAANVSGVIANGAGSVALSKTGAGTLTLSNANTYTGQTTVTQGTLSVTTTDALGTGAAVLVNGGTLALANNFVTVGAVTLTSGSITGSGDQLTATSYAVESGTISARLAGAGVTLTKTTAGTVTLSGANTFTGQMTVQNGTISVATINNDSNVGVLGNNALAVILGNTGGQTGTLRYTGATLSSSKKFTMATGGTGAFQVDTAATTLELTGLIDGSGALSKTGAGTLKISGANTSYSGATTVSAGTLILGDQNGFGTGTVTLAGGVNFRTTFEGNTVAGALPNAFILSGGKVNVDVSFGNKDIWINTAVSGPGGFVLTGSGRDQGLTLAGANTFQGGVTLGTVGSTDTTNVSITNVASLGTGTLRSELTSGSTTSGGLRLEADLSAGVANNIVIASGARIVVSNVSLLNPSQPATLSGIISDEGTGGGLIKQGGSVLTLSGANTFKGSTQVFSGVLALGHTSALGKSTLNYNNQGGTLSFGTLTAATLGGLTGAQGLALTNDSTQAVTLSVGNNNTNTTYTGTLTDGAAAGGGLTKTGTGTLTLSTNAALSQTGATNVNAGTLLLTGAAANVPTSAVSANSGGTLGVNTNVLTLNNTLTFNGTSGFQVQTGATATGSAVVNGNLAVNGTPTLRLASDNTTPTAGTKTFLTYTGTLTNNAAWTVDASLLNAGGSQVSNWTDGNSTWDTAANWSQQGWGGTVVYDNPNKQVQLTGFAVGNIAPFASTLATIAPGNAAAVTGPAAAASVASLTVGNGGANAHSLTLQASAPLTVTGPVTANGNGTINASAAALSAGTLNLSGGSVTLGAGSSAGTVNLTSGTLAATAGNELAVSSKLVKGTTTITAGTSAFKVGGSNVVSSIDKLMVQGGTTKIINSTVNNSISLTDTAAVVTSGGTSNTVSNAFTVTPGANSLVVAVTWREGNGSQNDGNVPTLTYNGVPLTLAKGAYGLVNGYVNSAIYYLFNPATGSNTLTTNFTLGGNSESTIAAYTLSGVDTAKSPQLITGNTGSTALEAVVTSVSTSLSNLTPHSWVTGAFAERIPHAPLTYSATGTFGSLNTSGALGATAVPANSGDFWFSATGGLINSAGVLVQDVTSETLTLTGSGATPTNRLSQAAAAFSPTSNVFAISQASTAVNVTGASTLDFSASPSVTLGSLTMESGSSLTLTNTPSVTFSNIVANGTSQIAAGVPITLSGGSVSVAAGQTLTVGNALTAGTLTKQGTGTLSFGAAAPLSGVGNLASTAGTTNVNTALGSGSAAVTLTGASTVKFGSVSQTLGSLTIGAGSTVTFTSGLASFSGGAGGKAPSFGGSGVVPEPGTIGLLLVGALGFLNRRRKA